MTYPDPKIPVRKTGISKPTPQNLLEVADQIRQVTLELQGVVGPEKLRAVRLQELLQTGVVKLTADGVLVAGTADAPASVDVSGLVPYIGATGDVDLGAFGLATGQVDLSTTPTGTPQVGTMVWNDVDGTVDIHLKGGNVVLQVGQEQLIRVVNGTGADLLESQYKAVRITGAQGQRPQVLLAQGNTEISSVDTIGLVTENIANNQEGFITTSGMVREIDTTGTLQGETWVDGDVLYLSPTVAGGVTKVKPTAPNHSVVVGIVVHAHANHGKIFVKVDNGYELEELHNVLITGATAGDFIQRDENGLWVNRTAEDAGVQTFHGFVFPYEVTLTYNAATRTTTLTPTGSTFDVWVQGKKYVKTGVQSIVHPNTSGDHFVYYNALGALEISSTPWDFKNVSPVAYIYYNATLVDGYALFELHTYKRNPEWHESQHFAIGTFVRSGLSISGFTLNTTTNAAVTPQFSSGVIVDEDIEYALSQVNDGGPYTIVHRTGPSLYTWTTTNTFPYRFGATYIQYNQFTGGNWQLTELATSQWVNYYVFATTAIASNKRLYLVPAQAVYSSLALAQAESVASLLLDGFGLTEFAPIYKLTFAALSTYTAVTGRVRLVAVERLTNTKGSLSLTLSSTLHNSLTGRSDADSHPIAAITGLDAALAGKLGVNDTAVNSDKVDGYHIQVDGTGTDPSTIYLKTTGGVVAGDKNYRHVQGTASASWSVTHNLDKYVAVVVVDSAGQVVEGDVSYVDVNSVVLTFSSAFAGEAFFN